jgi:hypothetical protein
MRRTFSLAITTVAALAASGSTAMAQGQPVCVGGPSTPLLTPRSNGQCLGNFTRTTLAGESEVSTLQTTVADLQGRLATLETANSGLSERVRALEGTLSKVSYDPDGKTANGKPTLTITGANLQLLSGSGNTAAAPNGKGNLIVGYDENAGDQSGSHNVLLGFGHRFTSYGGLIGGQNNALDGPLAAVFGLANTVQPGGEHASISGGNGNTVLAENASVSGGAVNFVSGRNSSIAGGDQNVVSGRQSSILGGFGNTVSGNCGTFPATGQAC